MKKKNLVLGLALFVSMIFSSGGVYAFDEAAKRLFDNGQYDECIQRMKANPELRKQRGNTFLLAYSNYQLYNFTKQDSYEDEFQKLYDLLLEKASADDLNSLLFLVDSSDKPAVVESSREFTSEIFEKMHKIDDVVKVLPFTSATDVEVRELAFGTMKKLMEPIREIVNKGGTMRPVDLTYFQNKAVIKSAMDNIDISEAQDLLVVIEEPALEVIESSNNPKLKAIAEDIADAISDRKKDYPNSLWYSATGKQLKASR